MPIYEYRCTQCGHEHDALQKFADAPLKTCPSCHQDALVKKLSAAGFQLKGSGWYVTDFRSKGGGGTKPAAAGDAAKADASPGGEAKGEAKSDTKSDSKSESSTSSSSSSSSSGGSTSGDSGSGGSAKSSSPG